MFADKTGIRSLDHKLCVSDNFYCPSTYAVAPKSLLCFYQDLKPLLRHFPSQRTLPMEIRRRRDPDSGYRKPSRRSAVIPFGTVPQSRTRIFARLLCGAFVSRGL